MRDQIYRFVKNLIQYVGIFAIRLLEMAFRVFPINRNRVVCIAYAGHQYACNPKYIAEHLLNSGQNRYQVIFILRRKCLCSVKEGIKTVRFLSIQHFYYLATAKVIIINGCSETYLVKRKGQFLLNTWHGGGAYKRNKQTVMKINRRLEEAFGYVGKMTDIMLSSSQAFSQYAIPDLTGGASVGILPCGMPRNDILFRDENDVIRRKVCKILKVNVNHHIILYVPTFRGHIQTPERNSMVSKQDIARICLAVRERFGGSVTFIARMHYSLHELSTDTNSFYVDATDYPDIQELLCAADILISDYSSTIWDFSLTKKPCFLYCPDMDYYVNRDRGVYTPIETWPGILCQSVDELEKAIMCLDTEAYKMRITKYLKNMGSYEMGTACEQVCRRIAEVCGVKE